MSLQEKVAGLLTKDVPLDEIEAAARFLFSRAKELNRRENARALDKFGPGDLVTLLPEQGTRRLPAGIIGKVERLGFKNISVDFGAYRKWRVPASWLIAAPEGAKFDSKIVTRESLLGAQPPRRRRQYQETPPDLA